MRAGQKIDMRRGAILACAIPVGLGIIGLIFILYDLTYFQQKRFIVRTHHYFTRPIVACFILGTPLAAWIACSRLREIGSSGKLSQWRTSAFAGLIGSTIVHIGAVVLYGLCVALFVDLTGGGYDKKQPDGEVLKIICGMLVGNIVPWVIVTLPLSLLCSTIFWRVTKFPKEHSS